MKMLTLTLLLAAAPALHAAPDLARLTDHIHKSFSTPKSMKLKVSGLKPSKVKGFLEGQLVISSPQGTQKQPLLVSEDGKWYFVGTAQPLSKSILPGFKKAGGKSAPEAHLTPDGSHLIFGKPYDASVDPDEDNLSKMKLKGVPSIGPKNAKVVLVEYSDLQCPHCKRSFDILKKELPAYFGKVRRVFKNYPLTNLHDWAMDGAVAIACAGKIKPKALFSMKEMFFAEQAQIKKSNIRQKAIGFARKTGLDSKKFITCFDKKESLPLVQADVREGESIGVDGTPAIFINGRKVRGYSFPAVKELLDEFLGS